jgi:hypothetical protein
LKYGQINDDGSLTRTIEIAFGAWRVRPGYLDYEERPKPW